MSYRFFAGFGKSFFSQAKTPIFNQPKNSFIKKMVHAQVVNSFAKLVLPASFNCLSIKNLTEILDKKEKSLAEIQKALNTMLGIKIDQGMILHQPNHCDLGITIGLTSKQCPWNTISTIE